MLTCTRRGPNHVWPIHCPSGGAKSRPVPAVDWPVEASQPGFEPRRAMAPEWARGKRGPAKAFDVDKALEATMLVFWKKGFEGKSLSDLTKAMDINRPSLYATFGDKQQLYGLTLGRFGELGRSVFESSTAESTARRFAEQLLRGRRSCIRGPSSPPAASSSRAPSVRARNRRPPGTRPPGERIGRASLLTGRPGGPARRSAKPGQGRTAEGLIPEAGAAHYGHSPHRNCQQPRRSDDR